MTSCKKPKKLRVKRQDQLESQDYFLYNTVEDERDLADLLNVNLRQEKTNDFSAYNDYGSFN